MMTQFQLLTLFALWLAGSLGTAGPAAAGALQEEIVTTSPAYADGVLYVASTEGANHRGHLRAVDILDTFPALLWDAAERMPFAGIDDVQPRTIHLGNLGRTLLTNLDNHLVALEAERSELLLSALGLGSVTDAEILLHAVRGRRGGTSDFPAGIDEDLQRLWGISRSSPVLVGESPAPQATRQRDRVLYVGAEDGQLHAFFISRHDAESGTYLPEDPLGGRELWAYLPGSFLPHLIDQPLVDNVEPLSVHLDGTPVVGDFFLDLDGDGQRNWQTLLIATGTMLLKRQSCLFVMNITDPYRPALLWERPLPGSGVGRTRGVRLARCQDQRSDCLYLTADFAPAINAAGIHALAVSLTTGQLLWQFSHRYAATGPVAEATPASPAGMDLDGDGQLDTLIFGDLVGQLWAIDVSDGQALGDRPIFQVPGGVDEPIGAGVTVSGQVAVFGTGGVAGSSDLSPYALYAVQVSVDGGRVMWTYPLQPGEKTWEAPLVDASGQVVFATATNYLMPAPSPDLRTTGRIVALDKDGQTPVHRDAAAGIVGRVIATPGLVLSVALTGEVTQFGSASRLTGPSGFFRPARVLSWRQR
jgi:outer membrane protein assembly factor BamB